jgi:hypothetical protein
VFARFSRLSWREEAMATLALKPIFPIRHGSSRPKRDHDSPGQVDSRTKFWHAVLTTVGACALTSFSVLAPMFGNTGERLLALDTTIAASFDAAYRDLSTAVAFEFTPITLGPAITAESLAILDEDAEVLTMPEIEIHARPPVEIEVAPPG